MESKDMGADTGFRLTVLQALGGSVLVVALVAVMFWVIGALGGTDDDLVVVMDEPGATDAPADESDQPAEEPGPEPEPDSEPDPEPEPDPEAEPDAEAEPPAENIAPGDITVQVLDGFQDDGGAAASRVADTLESAGYRIVARNPAIRYDVTAVLWTSGNEEAARQVAAAIGGAEVRAQPGTLSDAVAVHVVVGADRG